MVEHGLLNHLIRGHQQRLRSSGREPSPWKAVHISNDSSVMLPSSFGITRWCLRAIHIPLRRSHPLLLAAIRPDHSAVVSWLVSSFLQSILAGLLTAFLLRHWLAKIMRIVSSSADARPAPALACCLCTGRFAPRAPSSIRSLPISHAASTVPFRTRPLRRPRSPAIFRAAAIEPRTAATAADPASAPTSRAPEIAARAVSFTRFTAITEIGSLVSIASCAVRATVPTVGRARLRPIGRLLARFGPCSCLVSCRPARFGQPGQTAWLLKTSRRGTCRQGLP